MDAELFHDRGAVRPHRLGADAEPARDLLGAAAFREQLHDFAFARGQALRRLDRGAWRRRRVGPQEAAEEHLRDMLGEVGPMPRQRLDRGQYAARGVRLQQVTLRPGGEELADHPVRPVDGEHQDLGARRCLADPAEGLEAVQPGHTDVEDDDVGPERGGERHRFPPVRRLAAHGPAGPLLQRPAEPPPQDFVVIGDQDAQHGGPRWWSWRRPARGGRVRPHGGAYTGPSPPSATAASSARSVAACRPAATGGGIELRRADTKDEGSSASLRSAAFPSRVWCPPRGGP